MISSAQSISMKKSIGRIVSDCAVLIKIQSSIATLIEIFRERLHAYILNTSMVRRGSEDYLRLQFPVGSDAVQDRHI